MRGEEQKIARMEYFVLIYYLEICRLILNVEQNSNFLYVIVANKNKGGGGSLCGKEALVIGLWSSASILGSRLDILGEHMGRNWQLWWTSGYLVILN